MASVFLYAPEDFHNLCLLARTLEAFGERDIPVYDPYHLIRDRYGKVRSRELRAVSSGAFEKLHWLRLEQPEEYLAAHQGRLLAAVLDPKAVPLASHHFEATDLVLFGSESAGLPVPLVDKCSVAITIPTRGITQSLNLAVGLGIVLFERQRQLDARGA